MGHGGNAGDPMKYQGHGPTLAESATFHVRYGVRLSRRAPQSENDLARLAAQPKGRTIMTPRPPNHPSQRRGSAVSRSA